MTREPDRVLLRLLPQQGSVLVLHDERTSELAVRLGRELDDATVRAVVDPAGAVEPRSRWEAVVLLVADVVSLRLATPLLGECGRTRQVCVWLDEASAPVLPGWRPEWPPIATLQARTLRTRSGAVTSLRFARRLPAVSVLSELSRAAGTAGRGNPSGTIVASTRSRPDLVFPAGVGFQLSQEDPLVMATADVPPDLLISNEPATAADDNPVRARPLTRLDPPASWLGLDEGVLNPRGFVRVAEAPGAVLLGGDPCRLVQQHGELTLSNGLTPTVVDQLRSSSGVRVEWGSEGSRAQAVVVAGLAMAGVPVAAGPAPPGIVEILGSELTNLVSGAPDLVDPLSREEHSVRLRRTALTQHSSLALRRRLSLAAGRSAPLHPPVSVLLATKRPERLAFALRQVAKQRNVEIQLVVACHGWRADPEAVAEAAGGLSVHVLEAERSTPFGEVLSRAVRQAQHSLVVKMDDDDWYGPDFLADLLLARHYSAADVVGMVPDFVYLEPLGCTIRRRDDSERYAQFVAGGTMLVSRDFLDRIGGFRPVTRFVDAQLLSAARSAGGSIYRTHGLGYVVRRATGGHTWDPGIDYFLDERRLTDRWPGFRPSALLEPHPMDAPEPTIGHRDG